MTNQRDYILVVNDRLHCFPLIYFSVTPPRVADISLGEMSYHFFKGCKFRCDTYTLLTLPHVHQGCPANHAATSKSLVMHAMISNVFMPLWKRGLILNFYVLMCPLNLCGTKARMQGF